MSTCIGACEDVGIYNRPMMPQNSLDYTWEGNTLRYPTSWTTETKIHPKQKQCSLHYFGQDQFSGPAREISIAFGRSHLTH